MEDAGEADAAPAAVPSEARVVRATGEPDALSQMAAWINSGRYVPPCAVSTSMRAALLAAGLVTEAELRARQIF